MDREGWRAAVHGVAENRTQLSNWTELTPDIPKTLSHTIHIYSHAHITQIYFLSLPYTIQRKPHISYLDIPTPICPTPSGYTILFLTYYLDAPTLSHTILTHSLTHTPSRYTSYIYIPHTYIPQIHLHSEALHPDTATFIQFPNSVYPHSHIPHSDTPKLTFPI